jgi:membrane-associated phospholipid phosphatase
MLLLGLVLGAGVLAAAAVYGIALRWPEKTVAPKISGELIKEEIAKHPGLRAALRRRVDPGALTGLALTAAVALTAAGAVAVGILSQMARRNQGIARWDIRLARLGAQHETHLSTTVMRDISLLGGTLGIILIAVSITALEFRRIRQKSAVAFLVLVVAGQFALSNSVKIIVDRARPDIDRLTGFSGASFPSGHATAAAATFAACALLVGRSRRRRLKALCAAVAGGVAVSVAATRVFLGVHWLTDVIAGLFLGWSWFALCSIAFGGRLLRFGAPIAESEQVAVSQPTPDKSHANIAG